MKFKTVAGLCVLALPCVVAVVLTAQSSTPGMPPKPEPAPLTVEDDIFIMYWNLRHTVVDYFANCPPKDTHASTDSCEVIEARLKELIQ